MITSCLYVLCPGDQQGANRQNTTHVALNDMSRGLQRTPLDTVCITINSYVKTLSEETTTCIWFRVTAP